jgi:hypothetical protein
MKKLLSISLPFFLLACGRQEAVPYRSYLPPISMLLMDSNTRIHIKDIPGGRPIVFIYFQPDCIHCQQETAAILKNMNAFKDIRLYLLTPTYRPMLRKFYDHFHLADYKNIEVGVDEGLVFYKHFHSSQIPFLAVFGKDKRLIGARAGTFRIEELLDAIHNDHQPA